MVVRGILTASLTKVFVLFYLQIFHGVWTIAFFCLTVIDTKAMLPNASCLLAGYLPATTVLHILLIPNDYPLEFSITDAVGTFLAIITMFLLLRMECTGNKFRSFVGDMFWRIFKFISHIDRNSRGGRRNVATSI